jgi:hypothetical protein
MTEELVSYTTKDLADIDLLMHELSATSYCDETLLNNALNDANTHVYVIREETEGQEPVSRFMVNDNDMITMKDL